jgi:hypothetical protein
MNVFSFFLSFPSLRTRFTRETQPSQSPASNPPVRKISSIYTP